MLRSFKSSFHWPVLFWILQILVFFHSSQPLAQTDLDCYKMSAKCKGKAGYSNPSGSSQIRINPSNVPTEKGIGLVGIYYQDEVDVLLVRGLGRIGAAISPSNSEETFFGPPGVELDSDYLERKLISERYPNQKVTLATAFNVAERKGSALKGYSLNVGLMGRYNKRTQNVSPGAGLSGTLGPFSFGASIYKDETQLESTVSKSLVTSITRYEVRTFSGGLSLNSLIIDYSSLFFAI